jgi:hypothetical protein
MVKLKQEKSDKADTDDDGNEEDYEDFMYSLTSWGSLFLWMFNGRLHPELDAHGMFSVLALRLCCSNIIAHL